jgi:large subunit ribosomal protein L5
MTKKLNLKERFYSEIIPSLKNELKKNNVYQVPRVAKVVLNRGLGEALTNPKALDISVAEFSSITGQRPMITHARKAISNFKIRAKQAIGCRVTLRGQRMYDFLEKLINLALPKIRDFSGVSAQSFDGEGNYTIGIKDQTIFPEIDYDKVDKMRGMDITIVTTTKSKDESHMLLKKLGVPFKQEQKRA